MTKEPHLSAQWRRTRSRASFIVVAAAMQAGCADSVAPKGSVQHLVAVSGGGQAGLALDTLPEHLTVRVVDDAGDPVSGAAVSWSTADETLRVIPVDPVTTSMGQARAIVILGFNPGTQVVDARVAGLDEVVRFELTATPQQGFRAIALMRGRSFRHMCALDVDSLAWCWGDNTFGELGDGSTTPSEVPRKVFGDIRFASIAANNASTCGLTSTGALWCWGANSVGSALPAGAFGNGAIESSLVPVRGVPGLVLANFDMEEQVVCGVTTDRRGYCWGSGSLGTGSYQATTVPLEIAGDRKWREIAVGDDRRCAVAEDWKVYCWAEPHLDRWEWIGVREEAGPDHTPLPVAFIDGAVNLSSGWYTQCGISLGGAGTAVCWGVLNTGTYPLSPPGPTWLRLPRSIRTILTEGETGFLLDGRGEAWAWGGAPTCCDGFIGPAPVRVYPGATWSSASLAHELYAISARDSVIYTFRNLGYGFGQTPVTLVPMPAP